MVSKLDQEELFQTLSQLPENTSTIGLTIVENSSTLDGQDIPYLTTGLSSTTFDMQLNLLELLGLLKDISQGKQVQVYATGESPLRKSQLPALSSALKFLWAVEREC